MLWLFTLLAPMVINGIVFEQISRNPEFVFGVWVSMEAIHSKHWCFHTICESWFHDSAKFMQVQLPFTVYYIFDFHAGILRHRCFLFGVIIYTWYIDVWNSANLCLLSTMMDSDILLMFEIKSANHYPLRLWLPESTCHMSFITKSHDCKNQLANLANQQKTQCQ